MHRFSENVAAIATALAKAQTELSNPEKAMTGTVYNARSDTPQSYRYASLSSGLDIIRKVLGGQQIANRTDHRHRPGQWHRQSDDAPSAHLRGVDKPIIMPHMIEPLCLIEAVRSRHLFLAVFLGWENDFVPARELFRRP